MQGYKLSKEAQDDLKAIKNYSRETWGDKQAKEYLSESQSGLEKLVISPELGKSRDDIMERVRSFSVGRHNIFCRICNAEIEVARILHNRMDVTRRVGGF